MRTNAWITVENNLAISWWQWLQWFMGDQSGPEPAISEWDKKALQRLVDLTWSFQAFQPADTLGKTWRMFSVYDVTHGNIQAGFDQHGRAEEGGDLGCAGFWEWSPGDPICALSDVYEWYPNQVIKFMPDECVDPDCTQTEPATELKQISLLMGQPPRLLPPPVAQIDLVALVAYLVSEGWEASTTQNRIEVVYNGTSYTRTKQWLAQCDFSNVPGPLAFDVQQGLALQGFCIAP